MIPWKFKAGIFLLIWHLRQKWLLKFLQKNITKRSFAMESYSPLADFHLGSVRSLSNDKPTLLELGAGKNLIVPISLTSFVSSITTIDIDRLIDFELVNIAINRLGFEKNQQISQVEDLGRYFNIKYLAPMNINELEPAEGQFDLIMSTNTFEHIPEDVIGDILEAFKGLLVDGGIVSLIIDYSDHYSHVDPSIPPNNYKKYSKKTWDTFYNTPLHYQNRLSHEDYLSLFKACGYTVLTSIPLCSIWRSKKFVTSGHFRLKVDL